MKRIYMIDCPGIVPPNQQDSDEELLLRGSIRVENVEWPAQYVEAVLRRVEPKHLQRTYEVTGYKDSTGFLELLCRKQGRLLKGGEPDLDAVARIVLNDWIRGKIPWYTPLPAKEGETGGPVQGVEGREGRLGEMPRKRKRGSEATESVAAGHDTAVVQEEDDDDEFEGFSDDGGLGLDVDVSGDGEEEDAEDVEGGADARTLVAGEDASEDDREVEKEVAAISAALSKAKKRRRKE
jgi:nuclear GTP-binding protein